MDELDDLMKVEEESLDDNVHEVREAFKKKNNRTYGNFHMLGGGGGLEGVHFHMFSQLSQNAF